MAILLDISRKQTFSLTWEIVTRVLNIFFVFLQHLISDWIIWWSNRHQLCLHKHCLCSASISLPSQIAMQCWYWHGFATWSCWSPSQVFDCSDSSHTACFHTMICRINVVSRTDLLGHWTNEIVICYYGWKVYCWEWDKNQVKCL